MKITVNDSRTQGLDLVFTESLWTGRRTLTYNGNAAEKKSRKQFILHLSNGDIEFNIKGNIFSGITVLAPVLKEPVAVHKKLSPLAYVFSVLAVVLSIVCGILGGVVGGVIGGVLQGGVYGIIGGLFFALVLLAVTGIKRKWLRYLVCAELVIVSAGLAFFIGYGMALLMLAMIA